MKQILSIVFLVFVTATFAAPSTAWFRVFGQESIVKSKTFAEGWVADARKSYEAGLDQTMAHSGKASAYLKSIGSDEKERFGNIGQVIAADDYRGKRIRFSGYIKVNEADKAGLWLRIDGKEPGDVIALDNMGTRPIMGTKDWTLCEIILDVPDDADALVFGALLFGKGQTWIDSLKLEIVGKDVKTTAAQIPSTEERAKNKETIRAKIEEFKRANPQKADEIDKNLAPEQQKQREHKPTNLDFEGR